MGSSLTPVRREKGREVWKKGEGMSQITYTNVPWTWTTVWEPTEGVRRGLSEGGKGDKLGQL